ncbi:hypothetical protein JHK85_011256 [Glycine max]|nr:hypothetical protein JHK85_011256 [Glycine max]
MWHFFTHKGLIPSFNKQVIFINLNIFCSEYKEKKTIYITEGLNIIEIINKYRD